MNGIKLPKHSSGHLQFSSTNAVDPPISANLIKAKRLGDFLIPKYHEVKAISGITQGILPGDYSFLFQAVYCHDAGTGSMHCHCIGGFLGHHIKGVRSRLEGGLESCCLFGTPILLLISPENYDRLHVVIL